MFLISTEKTMLSVFFCFVYLILQLVKRFIFLMLSLKKKIKFKKNKFICTKLKIFMCACVCVCAATSGILEKLHIIILSKKPKLSGRESRGRSLVSFE